MALLFLFLAIPTTTNAGGFGRVFLDNYQWEGVFTGSRQTAMGNADLSGARGPSALLINTAPLPVDNGVEFEYGRADFVLDVDLEVYGISASWNGLRAGYTSLQWLQDPVEIRTAYNPDGTGEFIDFKLGMRILGLSYDLAHVLAPDSKLSWTAGAAYRRYNTAVGDYKSNSDTYDLGTSLSWRTDYTHGWTALKGAFSWMNYGEAGMEFDWRRGFEPQAKRRGLTIESAFNSSATNEELVRVILAYARTSREVYEKTDYSHMGAELVAFRTLALRGGHNSRFDGPNSWGAGLILARPFMGPVRMTVDYGRADSGFEVVNMWTVAGNFEF